MPVGVGLQADHFPHGAQRHIGRPAFSQVLQGRRPFVESKDHCKGQHSDGGITVLTHNAKDDSIALRLT